MTLAEHVAYLRHQVFCKPQVEAATVETLRKAGAHFRNEIVTGVGGKQIIVDDLSGNPVELFQPILSEARLDERS
jgi:hypothetical protein